MTRPGHDAAAGQVERRGARGRSHLAGIADGSMVPPLMMTVWLARAGAPVPSMTRTLVSATSGASTLMKPRTASLNCLRGNERRAGGRERKREDHSSDHPDLRYQVELPEGGGQRPISCRRMMTCPRWCALWVPCGRARHES